MAMISEIKAQNPQPSYMLVIDDVAINIQDKQFIDGFQNGLKTSRKDTVLTDQDLYDICLKIIQVQYPGKHQAGLIVGTLAALFGKSDNQCRFFNVAVPYQEALKQGQ